MTEAPDEGRSTPSDETGAAFAAFREAVLGDFSMRTWLLVPLDREPYVARVVSAGAARGFIFEAEQVRAALREGEATWLGQESDVA